MKKPTIGPVPSVPLQAESLNLSRDIRRLSIMADRLHAFQPGEATNYVTALAKAWRAVPQSNANAPRSFGGGPSETDTPGVTLLGLAQSFSQRQRLRLTIEGLALEMQVRTGELAAEKVPALMGQNAPDAVDTRDQPVSLAEYRDQLRLFYEALIWVLLLLDQAGKGGGLVRRRLTSPDQIFNVVGGHLESLTARRIEQYWLHRFIDPKTGLPFAQAPTRGLPGISTATDSPTLRLADFFKTIAKRARSEGVSLDSRRALALNTGVR